MIATDRMQAARIATGGKDAHVVPRAYVLREGWLRRTGGAIDERRSGRSRIMLPVTVNGDSVVVVDE